MNIRIPLTLAAMLTLATALSAQAPVQPAQTPAQIAAQPNVHHEADFDARRKQAIELTQAKRDLDALALCTDLERQDPADAFLAECHARALTAKFATETDATAAQRDHTESVAEFKRAHDLGDNSNLVMAALEIEAVPRSSTSGYAQTKNPEALAAMQQAEAAFSRRDMKTALAAYIRAGQADPTFYGAELYAGDACFSAADYACAGDWFARAIALDPNRETAYRYWGDALFKSGHPHEALQKYEQAIVAEPYTRLSWNGLLQYAQLTHTQMSSLSLPRPKVDPSNNKVNITLSPGGPPAAMMAWLSYAGCRTGDIKKAAADKAANKSNPMPAYSPELEATCLDTAASAVLAAKPRDSDLTPDLRGLLALQKDGMIECWVLINSGDPQSLQTYAAYRDAHRDLLIAYLDKYVVHEGVQAKQPPQLSPGR